MHLKSLTLKGFKSFAQSTTFVFEPGVTAIIGPNGSGKSNVLDALAWVMGEQGAKSLRGGKMEDVIFAGTATRGPLGRAEVKLTIDNADGALPIDYTEVTISRTLFRSGSSEYAINGEGCRLLDVQELLSDSGLGREMHVIVGQGQLDAVLRATPEDRRGFIEEAAGILKHRRRKERTLRKLESMETNLTRLKDLAGEIHRQLKPLGKQAEIAKQAQVIAAEVRDAKARLLAHDVARLRAELAKLMRDDAEQHSEKMVLQEQLEQKQLRISHLEHERQDEELDRARRVVLALESSLTRLRGVYAQAQQRLTFLATQAESPHQFGLLAESMVTEAELEATLLHQIIATVEAQWVSSVELTAQAQQKLDALDEHLSTQTALLSSHQLQAAELRGKHEAAIQKHTVISREVLRNQEALAQAQTRATQATQAQREFDSEHSSDHSVPANLDLLHVNAQQQQTTAELRRENIQVKLHALAQEEAGLAASIAALSPLLDQRDASPALLAADVNGIRGLVAEHIQVAEGAEAGVGAALGVFADALLVHEPAQAFHLLTLAHERDYGRVQAVIASSSPAPSHPMPVVAGLTRVLDVLHSAPEGVRQILAYSYIAPDLRSAASAMQKLQHTHPGEAFTIVTAAGEVVTRHTFSGGSGISPSRIELLSERDSAAARLREVTDAHATLAAELEAQRETVLACKQAAEQAFAALRAADAQSLETAQQRNRLVVQVETSIAEATRAEQSLNQVVQSEAAAAHELTLTAKRVETFETQPEPILDVSERSALLEELHHLQTEDMAIRLDLETARERARAATVYHEQLLLQRESERQAAEDAARRTVLRARQIERAEYVLQLLPEIIRSCETSLDQARAMQQQTEQQRSAHSQELTLIRSEEAELRERLHRLTEVLHGAELKSYERKLHLSSLLERAAKELGLTEEVLIAEYAPIATGFTAVRIGATAELTRAEYEHKLQTSERKLVELGRINPLALEEYAALEQRYLFLSDQLQDLSKTRTDLMKIIGDIDEKMQDIFTTAFADTQTAFAGVFPLLFPGGVGEITLADPTDLLHTGIEMTVRPAGKKVERISLLSGGERSLAAIAWLVAIFRARPSPFYIMDEVEAALDDANLGRLLHVFETLRENSQLIVITHQKRTMEIADALYGVSMRQDGISAVIGQRAGSE